MADQNLFAQGLSGTSTATATPSPATEASPNLFAAGLSGSPPSSSEPQSAPTPSPDSANLFNAGLGLPSAQKPDNPQQGLLGKAWDTANTPLTESLFGLPEYRQGAGGLERGAEKVLSGFTSPLSLLLAVGSFGTGGFLESAGANVLKSTLMAGADGIDAAAAADKVAQFGKAAEAATDAFKTTGQSVKGAVEATGMNFNEFRSLQNTLYDSGLRESDVLGGNLTTRGISSAFRNLGVGAVKAQKIAKGTQFLMDAGFTGQQVSQAVQTVPKVFDLLKEGRYDEASEYMVEGGVGGTLGLLGASHALHTAGETFGSPNEIEKLRPSDENQKLNKTLNERDLSHQDANLAAKNWEEDIRKEMGEKLGFAKVFESGASREAADAKARKLLVALDTGNDPELARQTGNALAEAIGQPERKLDFQADYKPGEFADLEQQILGLKLNKPLDEVSPNDVLKAGGGHELANDWGNYANITGFIGLKDKAGVYGVPPEDLSREATFHVLSAQEGHPPAIVLNPFATEIVNRAAEKIDGQRNDDWRGVNVRRPELDQISAEIEKQAQNVPEKDRQGYNWAISAINAVKKTGSDTFALLRDRGGIKETYDHEATHSWQDANPVSTDKINNFIADLSLETSKAIKYLRDLGYKGNKELFEEIGTFVSEGGEDLREHADFTRKEVNDLAQKYYSLYNEDALKTLPSEHSTVRQALKDIGHENINRGRNRAVPEGASRGLSPFNGSNSHPGLPENLAELVTNSKLNDKQKAYVSKFVDAYHDAAKGLSDDEQGIYQKLRDRDDQNWNEGSTNGLITSRIEDHIQHVWENPEGIGNRLIQEARVGNLETNVTQARKRLWNTFAEGLLKGRQLKPEGEDPVSVIGWNMANIRKAAANRQMIDNLRDGYIRGSDGRPLTVLSGEGHAVEGQNGENPAVMVNMNRVRDIRIADNVISTLRQSGELQRFLDRGDIIPLTQKIRPDNIDSYIDKFENKGVGQNAQYDPQGNNILRKDIDTLKKVKSGELPASALDEINARQKENYAWHPQDYVTPRDKSLSGWNWLTKTDDGTNILARSNIKFHPEVADYLINRLNLEKSYLRENKGIGKITKPILTAGGEAKKILLSFSPFHLQQEALRAIMMGVNPLRVNPIRELNARPDLRTSVENGLTIAPDHAALQEHSSGVAEHSKALSKIPILGKAMDWYQDFLFNRYIPSMKAQSAEVMYRKYEQSHPDWTRDAVGKAVADHVNAAFGGQNWRAMGRAAATQDWFHLFALAPDWLEGEARFAASTLRGGLQGRNFAREQVGKMALGLWGTARVLNMLTTGNMHLEAPFGLAVKDKDGKESIYSVRTLPTDILHMASDPAGFIKGRMSPFARLTEEAASGRDSFGRKLSPGDLAIDIARNMVPIPAQAIGQMATGETPSVGNAGQLLKASGVTVTPYKTEAQKLAGNLAAETSESGPVNPVKMARSQALAKIEDDVRSGNATLSQLNDARDFGSLTPEEHKKIVNNIKLTVGMDPSTARMVSNVSRMDMPSALKVWDAATPSEKSAMVKAMLKKKNSYMMKSIKEMTPEERLNDPTFRRIRLLFNQSLTESNP